MKIAVIGGGSTYTPEIVNGFIARIGQLPLDELWLMDISESRLETVGGFAQRMTEAAGNPFEIRLTTDQREAIKDADYVVTQVRVGGMKARRADEYLGQRYGLVGQETTGVGGMSKALRTIPVILQVARHMEVLAPKALLLNFTNPAGLVTEAITRHSSINVVGVCNGPFSIQRQLLGLLENRKGISTQDKAAHMDVLGINHLSWQYGMTLDGKDVWADVMDAYLDYVREGNTPFDPRTIEMLNMVPSAYLQYYYHTDRKIAEQAEWPPSRAEQVMQIEEGLLEKYNDKHRNQPPDELMQRGGAYYSTVATQMINAHYNDLGEIHAANVRHNGAVDETPSDWVLEMNCRVDRSGIHPMKAAQLPQVCHGLLANVKAYELLTVEAAVNGDRKAAYEAILAHPLRPAADRIQALLDDMLETHRDYLPQFWEKKRVL